jgi:hypothetical protein
MQRVCRVKKGDAEMSLYGIWDMPDLSARFSAVTDRSAGTIRKNLFIGRY